MGVPYGLSGETLWPPGPTSHGQKMTNAFYVGGNSPVRIDER
jgi:hypothetical protein